MFKDSLSSEPSRRVEPKLNVIRATIARIARVMRVLKTPIVAGAKDGGLMKFGVTPGGG